MKPTGCSILSGCGCATLTVIVGGPLIVLICWLLYEFVDVKELTEEPAMVIAVLVSLPAGIILGFLTGFLVYRWRQKKEPDALSAG